MTTKLDMSAIVADTNLTSAEKLVTETEAIAASVGITLEELAYYQNLLMVNDSLPEIEGVVSEGILKSFGTTEIVSPLVSVIDPLELAQQKVDEFNEAFSLMYMATALFVGTGSGTDDDPYIISNTSQMQAPNDDLTAAYALGDNIDMTGIEHTPWGSSDASFSGTFDGRGYSITNLTIDSADGYQGLFGRVTTGTRISNVILNDVNITGGTYIGSLVGLVAGNNTIITNVHASGYVTGTSTHTGGLIGYTISSGHYLTHSSSACTVTGGGQQTGGLVGYAYATASYITDCYTTGNVTGTTYIGGLTGQSRTNIQRCWVSGNVTATGSFVGGITGHQWEHGQIMDCYVTGNVTGGAAYIGGIVGRLYDNAVILRCYATGSVSAGSSTNGRAGGIIGEVTTGTTMSGLVALNPTITGTGTIGRVVGVINSNPITAAYASETTLVNGAVITSGTSTNRQGADVDAATYHTKAFYQDTLGWGFAENATTPNDPNKPWYFDPALQLPVLIPTITPVMYRASVTPKDPKKSKVVKLDASAFHVPYCKWEILLDDVWTEILTSEYTLPAYGEYQFRVTAENQIGTAELYTSYVAAKGSVGIHQQCMALNNR